MLMGQPFWKFPKGAGEESGCKSVEGVGEDSDCKCPEEAWVCGCMCNPPSGNSPQRFQYTPNTRSEDIGNLLINKPRLSTLRGIL